MVSSPYRSGPWRAIRIIMISHQSITIEGRQAKYWIGGSGKPLVLIHGGLGDAQQHWSPIV